MCCFHKSSVRWNLSSHISTRVCLPSVIACFLSRVRARVPICQESDLDASPSRSPPCPAALYTHFVLSRFHTVPSAALSIFKRGRSKRESDGAEASETRCSIGVDAGVSAAMCGEAARADGGTAGRRRLYNLGPIRAYSSLLRLLESHPNRVTHHPGASPSKPRARRLGDDERSTPAAPGF